MPALQSPGIGSGLDLSSLVQQLVTAERQPIEQRLTQREARITTQVSALAALKGALSSFKSALENLKSVDTFLARKATISDESVLAVSAGTTAAPGTYTLEVVNLAEAHQLASDPFTDGADAVVGTGTLTISLGSESFQVTIGEEDRTLAGIRDAINESDDNPGVIATLVHGVDGSRLVLTSSKTGASNAIEVAASGGDGGLDALAYDPGATTNLSELRAARDALVRIAGMDHESADNEIEDAIDGVTLTLKTAKPGTELTLTVQHDIALIKERINKFITEYNSLNSRIASLRSYDPNTQRAGPMLGDALLRGIEGQIRRDLMSAVDGLGGEYQTLASLGIKTTSTGNLTVDAAKLDAALGNDLEAVAAIFGSEDGIAARLYEQIDMRLESGGALDSRNDSLQKGLKQIAKDRDALELRMQKLEDRYRKQFMALDTLLSNLQSTASYLSQQLANLPKPGSR